MDINRLYLIIYLTLSISWQCMLQNIPHSSNFIFEDEKVELRKTLDEVTQAQIVGNQENHLYHNYIFRSGVGNREGVQIDLIERDIQFKTEARVGAWQSVQCRGQVFLLGYSHSSVSLLITSSQLPSNRSAQFSEHTLDLGSNVTSISLFSRWNALLSQDEVIVAVAINSSAADILWYKVEQNKLVKISRWSRYKQTSFMAAIKTGETDQLVVVDTSSPSTVDVFDIIFTYDGSSLDLRLVQSFPLATKCSSVTVCQVARHIYLVFIQPSHQSLAVYRQLNSANTSFFENYTTLTFPKVSQVVSFSVASQVYLAINGENGFVFRLTDTGHFVEELSSGSVIRWLAVPVASYRSDVILFSQDANETKAFVWAGTDKGFTPAKMPDCDNCLEGDWTGAVSLQLRDRNCLLLPQGGNASNMVTVVTSLHSNKNPFKEQIDSMIQSMKQYEERLNKIHVGLLEAEESLKHIIKVNGENIITAKWKFGEIYTPSLILSSMVNHKSELGNSSEPFIGETNDVSILTSKVEDLLRSANILQKDVLLKDNQVWGLDKFSGKLTVKGRIIVGNLTVTNLNGNLVDDILQNSYRKGKPQTIFGSTVIESLQVEDLYFDKVNKNLTKENMKFSDDPVLMRGNVTFLSPVKVNGKLVLEDGGCVNGLNLSQQLCQREKHCTVFPSTDVDARGKDSKTHEFFDVRQQTWKNVIGGKNITVMKVNNIDWETLRKNIVFTDKYQQIPGTTIVKGIITSDAPVWIGSLEEDYNPQQRDAGKPVKITETPTVADGKINQNVLPINPYSDVIFTELEVTGTIKCDESEWGALASDIILSDANPIHIYGDKVFMSDVNVKNNLEVNGLVGTVDISELLTMDTNQIFTDSTTLHGNVSIGNITLSGFLNRLNITNSTRRGFSIGAEFMREVTAGRVTVTDTLNGVPLTEFVFTNSKGVASVSELNASDLSVTSQIIVSEKVCNQDLRDFKERRLSIKEDQNISGDYIIDNASVIHNFEVIMLNGKEISNMSNGLGFLTEIGEMQLSELFVDGDITTDFGLNGYNLSQVAENAVMLHSNNVVTGHLNFKDNVTFELLDCQGFFNLEVCQKTLDFSDVVFKTNETNLFSGKKTFSNYLNILQDLEVEQLNGHKFESILTKTTNQVIEGNLSVYGNTRVHEEFILDGFLNNQNLTDIGSRCLVSNNTIKCTGDAKFEESVNIDHFSCKESINGINFDRFAESLVDVKNPQPIKGKKKFSGMTSIINLEVYQINENIWDDFVLNTITQNMNDEVLGAITFTEKVMASSLSVDYNLNADSVNGVDLNEWRNNAIYLNNSFYLNRTLHLSSASSAGNLTVVTYGDVNMDVDVIRLHTPNSIHHLHFESVTVLNSSNLDSSVNGYSLYNEEQKTLKIFGDQIMMSDVVLTGDVSVSGNVTFLGLVNTNNLLDLVTLDTDQHLHGNYNFKCMEVVDNMTSTGLMSTVNMSEWKDSALMDEGEQDVTRTLTMLGDVQLKGSVHGKGRLGSVNLVEVKDNITRDILDVHRDLKVNLTLACEKTNRLINLARNQTSKFLFLDLSQEISVGGDISLVAHFKNTDGDFLTVSDKKCSTTIYKWDKVNSSYSRLFSEVLGYELSQLVALQYNQLTYLVSVSADVSMECYFSDKHLWLFSQNSIKHVSLVDLGPTDAIQAHNNRLYSMNSTGLYKWTMQMTYKEVKFHLEQMWTVSTAGKMFIPEETGPGLAFSDSSFESEILVDTEIINNCSGEVISVSISAEHHLIAAATIEKTQVPRYSNHVKIYHLNGSLFDKIPAQNASHLHWFPVPGQIWLVFIDNNSFIKLYHLQGVLEGFQLMFSAKMEGITGFSSLALPSSRKVNLQPYLIVQTLSSVKVIQTFLEGDPYLKPDVSCFFDDALHTINSL